jgi:hypothetical protein
LEKVESKTIDTKVEQKTIDTKVEPKLILGNESYRFIESK